MKGNAELMAAGSALSPDELKVLVLVDGIATVGEIAANAQHGLSNADAMAALDKLSRAKYIADPDATASINVGDFFKESEAGVQSLQANGFYVRIARRAEPRKAEGKLTVLAIEDDPALTKLLKMYLQMENFTVRIAATRAEIDTALREPPKPDIVLLDGQLPDADGFDLLKKMRAHEFMKAVPIIMATAKASREAVLNGLKGGADGYVTKPYDMEVLLKAMRSVLGLAK
jgi:two-component system, OmpR family, response regulator